MQAGHLRSLLARSIPQSKDAELDFFQVVEREGGRYLAELGVEQAYSRNLSLKLDCRFTGYGDETSSPMTRLPRSRTRCIPCAWVNYRFGQ